MIYRFSRKHMIYRFSHRRMSKDWKAKQNKNLWEQERKPKVQTIIDKVDGISK